MPGQRRGCFSHAIYRGGRLVVLPEMATTGYRFSSLGEIAPLVEREVRGLPPGRPVAVAVRSTGRLREP